MPPTKHTLLIVDDEPDVLESLRYLFHRQYRVVTAASGSEGLEILASEPVQIVLSDQRMPAMSGDEFLSKVREQFPDAIRLMFTGYADIQAILRAINYGGIFRYILKPWEVGELEAVLKQASEQYNLRAERRRLLAELQDANVRLTRANTELAESDALKSAFLEVASHELNTPITLVQGLSELLRLLNPDREPREREIVAQITNASRRLARLVTTMLKLLRANDFHQDLRWKTIDLSRFLREVASTVDAFIAARSLRFQVDVADDLGPFEVDPDKIRDVVLNLLTNAIKFTPDGGEVALRARLETADWAMIEVSDRGVGLDERALAHLFEPFFTEFDPSRHSTGDFGFNKRGLGLGLSLVKRFVERHGGAVAAESVLGEGTTIRVRLPRRRSGLDSEGAGVNI